MYYFHVYETWVEFVSDYWITFGLQSNVFWAQIVPSLFYWKSWPNSIHTCLYAYVFVLTSLYLYEEIFERQILHHTWKSFYQNNTARCFRKIARTFGNRTFYYVKDRYFTSKWWLRINLIFAARQAFHSPRPKSRKRFFRPKIRHTKRKKWQTTSVIITQKWISQSHWRQ